MPGYLQVADTWLEVTGVSVGHSVDYGRSVVLETTLSGRRRAQVAPPPAHRDWQVRLGLADAETLRLWERLLDGAYGIGPFDWVDPYKAAAHAQDVTPNGPPAGAVPRPVVITGMNRVDRLATAELQYTAITVTLSEVGAGVDG